MLRVVIRRLPDVRRLPALAGTSQTSNYSDSSSSSGAEPPKRGRGRLVFVSTVFGAAALAAGTLAYAKQNQDVRDILKDYAPWTDDVIAVMYAEKETPLSNGITFITNIPSNISKFLGGDDQESASHVPLKPISKIEPIISPGAPKKVEKVEKPILEKPVVRAPVAPIFEAPKPKPEVVEIEIVSSEDAKAMEIASKSLILVYKRAIETSNRYIKHFETIMKNATENVDEKSLKELYQAAFDENEIKKDICNAAKKLEEVLGGSKNSIAMRIRQEVEKVKNEYEKASSSAVITARYWPQIENARKYFLEELQAVFPGADIGAPKLEIVGGNLDALLLMTLRRVLLYQQMLARQDALLTRKVDGHLALSGVDEDLIKNKIEIELDKERRKLALAHQKKEIAIQREAKRMLDIELKKQIDLHNSHLQDAVNDHAREVIKAERKIAEEKAETQRVNYELKLGGILGKLQGVDEALKARANSDKMTRQSQKLWAACEALESALRTDSYLPKPLSKELNEIASVAADSDELVTAVLRSVPSVIRDRGVFSELALRERFNKVETACRRVALVPEEGAALPVYLFSWLQSVFLMKGSKIPKEELENQVVDFSALDTHEILERVRYWVERCDWAQALRYVHLLSGAPSVVAKDWSNEVLLHLEARQAAKTLLAHACATGLVYL